jgi:hypothetical protein
MFDASYTLPPTAFLSAWQPETLRLRLGARAAARARDRAAVRIRLEGSAVEATVVGTVAEVRPAAGRFEVDVAPDAASLSLVRLLLAAARSQAGLVARRPPRWRVRLPATVTLRDASTVRVSTVSVSDGGCGLDWAAPPPDVGQVLRIQVGVGALLGENRGAVCWRSPLEPTVGVQFAGRAPGGWAALIAQLARGGAPRA